VAAGLASVAGLVTVMAVGATVDALWRGLRQRR